MQKRYPLFKAPLLAFFSKDFYVDVAYNWSGTGALYMVALVSLSWLITVTLTVALPCLRILSDQELPKLCQQMPRITIGEGCLSIDKPYPYAVNDSKGKTVVMFLAESRTSGPGDPAIVVTKDALAIRIPGVGLRTCKFDSFAGLKTKTEIDVNSIYSSIRNLLPWLPAFYLIVGTPIVLVLHLAQMLLYGCAAMLTAAACKRQITYKTGLRLAAVAMTPAIVCSNVIVIAMFLLFPLQFLHLLIVYAPVHSWAVHHPFAVISVILALTYLVFGCMSLKSQAQTTPI